MKLNRNQKSRYHRSQDTEELPPSSFVSLWPLCETLLPVPVHSALAPKRLLRPHSFSIQHSEFSIGAEAPWRCSARKG